MYERQVALENVREAAERKREADAALDKALAEAFKMGGIPTDEIAQVAGVNRRTGYKLKARLG